MKPSLDQLRPHLPALAAACAILLVAFFVPRLLNHTSTTLVSTTGGDVDGFARDCIDHVLNRNDIPSTCASLAAIQHAYHLDANALLVTQQGRMITTAQRIARGDIADEKTYRSCVKNGDCAEVPVFERNIDPTSVQGRARHAEFWHLVNQGSITAQNCEAMDVCKALVKIGVIQPPPALTAQP